MDEPLDCMVQWPADPTDGDRLHTRPMHYCRLEAGHVHDIVDPWTLDEHGKPAPRRTPHRCHCGAWLPVRDVEPTR